MGSPIQIPELLQTIFRASREDVGPRRDLCHFARVCRTWHDAAIPLIWEELFDLAYLLQRLPRNARTVQITGAYLGQQRNIGIAFPTFDITRPLTKEDWAPVLERSRFIKHFGFLEILSEPRNYSPATIDAILQCPYPLFPSLRSLNISIRNPTEQHTDLVQSLLRPTVTALVIQYYQSSKILGNCNLLARRCPSLRRIHLDTSSSCATAVPSMEIADAIAAWSSLHSVDLKIDACHPNLLASLARSTSLVDLALSFTDSDSAGGTLPLNEPVAPGFTALQTLKLRNVSVSRACGLLAALDGSPIETICLAPVLLRQSQDSLRIVLESIRAHCSPQTMREIEIFFEGLDAVEVFGDHWLRTPLDMHTMRILSGFRELTSVWLDVTLGTALTDDDYAGLTRWWPNLLNFDVSTISMLRLSEGVEKTPATLHTLVHFADNCPHLERLSVPLSTDEGPPVNRKFYARRTQKHPLVSLDVGDSPVEPGSENDLVLLLCSLFPGMRDPEFSLLSFEADEPWSAGWKDVEKRLHLLRQMARYEDIERRLEDGTLELD